MYAYKRLPTAFVVATLACSTVIALAPDAAAKPCSYTKVPQEGEIVNEMLSAISSLSSGSSGSSTSSGSTSTQSQRRYPGQIPILEGHTKALHLITGPGSPQRLDRRFGVSGSDLGISWLDDSGKTYLAFGDTMDCRSEADGWRSNVIMRTTDNNYQDFLQIEEALTTEGWRESGYAQEFAPSLKIPGTEHTTIPTAGIYVNGSHYVDVMSVRSWLEPGNWTTNFAATLQSADGVQWRLVPDSVRMNRVSSHTPTDTPLAKYQPGNENLQISSFVKDDTYVYRFSTGQGRHHGAVLARAEHAQFPAESAWQYWDGKQWTDHSTDAAIVLNSPVPETSVMYHPGIQKWLALHGGDIRVADSITGPWSSRISLISTNIIADLYGGFILPHQSGTSLYWVATTWDAYNVMLMKTELTEVDGVLQPSTITSRAFDPRATTGVKLIGYLDYAPDATDHVTERLEGSIPQGVKVTAVPQPQ